MKDKIATAKTLIERLRGFHQIVYEMRTGSESTV